MKKVFLFTFLLFINSVVFGQLNSGSITLKIIQEKSDTIQKISSLKGLAYFRKGVALNYRDMKGVFSKNTKAYDEFAIARKYNSTSTLFAIGGSCVLFYGLISYIVYDNEVSNRNFGIYQPSFNSSPIFIGLGAIAVSIPLGIASKVSLRKAVETYNGSLNYQTSQSLKLNLGVNSNGLGLLMTF